MGKVFILAFIVLLVMAVNSAQAVTIDWASSVYDSNALDANRVLGRPDGMHAMFGNNAGIIRTATYSGFGNGDSIEYSDITLANLLGTSNEILAKADFFTTEYSGAIGPYESGTWLFSDGSNSFSLFFDSVYPDALAPTVTWGTITNSAYANYFGFTNTARDIGGWGYLLFDINGYSNVNVASPNFSVTLSATDNWGPTSPDPDVMGRIQSIPNPVPEPASILLFGIGGLAMAVLKKRKKAATLNLGTRVCKI